ncbi:hypothetical protein OG285_19695 [Streptomyces sp. NBC_01471]
MVGGAAASAIKAAGYAPRLIIGDGLRGDPDGVAYDRLIATCSVRYIPVPWLHQVKPGRPHDRPPRPTLALLPGEERPSGIDPEIIDTWAGSWVAQLAAPSAERMGVAAEQILWDVSTGSQSRTTPRPDGGWTVVQRGPARLWNQVETAVRSWQAVGRTAPGGLRHHGLGGPPARVDRHRGRAGLGPADLSCPTLHRRMGQP